MYTQSMFWAKIRKNIDIFLLKIFIFYNFKNLYIIHGHVFVMSSKCASHQKMVRGGWREAKLSFIPSGRGPHWKLDNQSLVNFKCRKSDQIKGCIM